MIRVQDLLGPLTLGLATFGGVGLGVPAMGKPSISRASEPIILGTGSKVDCTESLKMKLQSLVTSQKMGLIVVMRRLAELQERLSNFWNISFNFML